MWRSNPNDVAAGSEDESPGAYWVKIRPIEADQTYLERFNVKTEPSNTNLPPAVAADTNPSPPPATAPSAPEPASPGRGGNGVDANPHGLVCPSCGANMMITFHVMRGTTSRRCINADCPSRKEGR